MRYSSSPFTGAQERYSELSSALNNYATTMAGVSVPGSGAAANALSSRIEGRATTVSQMSQDASTVSDSCGEQASADVELMSAPSVSEVENLKERVTEASQNLANGTGTADDLDAARESYQEAKAKSDEARRVHAEKTGETSFPDSTFSSGDGSMEASASGGSGGSGGGGDAGSGGGSSSGDSSSMSGGGSPMDSDSPAGDTELSSDEAAPAGASPMLGGGAPQQQMPQSQPQQPQMAPMQPQQQAPSSGAGAATGPYTGTRDTAKSARDLANRFGGYNTPRLDTSVGTATSGDSGPIDRGSSVTSQTTRADVSGAGSTALSSGTAGQAGQNAQQNQGAMRGGGMGGMPMGGMGAGGGGGTAKERPNILTTDPELLGTEDLEQSIAGGIIGRDTSTSPNQP